MSRNLYLVDSASISMHSPNPNEPLIGKKKRGLKYRQYQSVTFNEELHDRKSRLERRVKRPFECQCIRLPTGKM